MNDEIITLDYGSGGKKTAKLIESMILPAMNNAALGELNDGAVIAGAEKLVFSTDSFVVSPIFFPGGDIGKLAVCGTVNDISMCGGEAKYLSCSYIIEEGFSMRELERIVASMAAECAKCGVEIVTGDTKVVEKGRGDGIYINTAGIGFLRYPNLNPKNVTAGDSVIVSGTVGDHGVAVMLARNGMMQGDLKSDCAALGKMAAAVMEACPHARAMRDPTRGGLATTLNEFVEGTSLGIELREENIPVKPQVTAACDMLGLDPLYAANEGKLVCIVPPEEEKAALDAMKRFDIGADAAVIGRVSERFPGRLVMNTAFGGNRILQKLTGAQLPRIC